MIVPTVGRIVWYRSSMFGDSQPWAAIVTYVHSDREVNLFVIDRIGDTVRAEHVQLIQEGDEVPDHGIYAEWMPYQIGQAKKHEGKPA